MFTFASYFVSDVNREILCRPTSEEYGRHFKLTFNFITMSNALSARIREITIEKMDLQNDTREGHLKDYANATLDLDDAADEFVALAGGDASQEEIANALVDLADLVDDVDLSPTQNDKLDSVVDRLLKTGSDEQKQGAKVLFHKVLAYGQAAKAQNAYFDTLLEADPNEE